MSQVPRLVERNGLVLPRIAAVHDLCGYGKCSLSTAIPVLSAAGVDVCPLPTALLSSHTHFSPYTFLDNTEEMAPYLQAWQAVGLEIEAIYSGFLASPKQVKHIQALYTQHPTALRFFDPVMGDRGRLYPTYTQELCDAMRDLAKSATLLTPNLTEASILTGLPYQGESPSTDEVKRLGEALLVLGSRYVVLKGIRQGDQILNYVLGVDLEPQYRSQSCLPIQLHGTGDLFCSSLIAALYCECTLIEAVDFAALLVKAALEDSYAQPQFEDRGVSFERQLWRITDLLRKLPV